MPKGVGYILLSLSALMLNNNRIVSSLPSTHLRKRLVEEKQIPLHPSPHWIRQHFLGKLRREGALLLSGLDSRLSKDLPPDLQKIRCKVAFHALRFAPRIMEIGNKIAERMQSINCHHLVAAKYKF